MLSSRTKPSTPPKPNAPQRQAMPFSDDDPKRQQKLLIAGIGGAALAVAATVLLIFQPWHRPVPRLNDEPARIAQLASSSDFARLPFSTRETYMKVMDQKKAQIEQAYANGKLTDDEYRKALEAAHLGRLLGHMKKYYARPPGRARDAYLDKVIDKKEKKVISLKKNPTAKKEKKAEAIPRDDSEEDAEINSWPPDVRAQFLQFRQILNDRKKLHKDLKKAAEPANTQQSTTQPAGG
jgi:hypothetical protein